MVDIINFFDSVDLGKDVSDVGDDLVIFNDILLLDMLFEVLDSSSHSGKHSQHTSYTNSITFNHFSNKMETHLDIIDRFVGIVGMGDNSNDRLQTEWSYLYKLLKSQPIAYDRIEAYLSILQQQDSKKSKGIRGSNSHLQHPNSKRHRLAVDGLLKMQTDNDDKIKALRK